MTTGRFTVHGARGSIPAPGPDRARYGGHTTCFSVSAGPGQALVIDAGTGLAFADQLLHSGPTHFHVLLTHYHLDHLLGLLSFPPFFDAAQRFTFYCPPPESGTPEQAIGRVFAPPLFPVAIEDVPARLHFVTLDGGPFDVVGVRVSMAQLNHPQGAFAYRLGRDGRSVVVATDHESDRGAHDAPLVELARGANVLIHDAQYTPDEVVRLYDGWGHSTWEDAVRVALASGVDRLVLTSHDPHRCDDAIDAIVAAAAEEFPAVVAAREGLAFPL